MSTAWRVLENGYIRERIQDEVKDTYVASSNLLVWDPLSHAHVTRSRATPRRCTSFNGLCTATSIATLAIARWSDMSYIWFQNTKLVRNVECNSKGEFSMSRLAKASAIINQNTMHNCTESHCRMGGDFVQLYTCNCERFSNKFGWVINVCSK